MVFVRVFYSNLLLSIARIPFGPWTMALEAANIIRRGSKGKRNLCLTYVKRCRIMGEIRGGAYMGEWWLTIQNSTVVAAIIAGVFSIICTIISRTGKNESKPNNTQARRIKRSRYQVKDYSGYRGGIEDYRKYLPPYLPPNERGEIEDYEVYAKQYYAKQYREYLDKQQKRKTVPFWLAVILAVIAVILIIGYLLIRFVF